MLPLKRYCPGRRNNNLFPLPAFSFLTRSVDERTNQILLRIDENDKCKPINHTTLTNTIFSNYDAIIVSDYDKGFLTEDDINFISNSHPLTFLDTKKKLIILNCFRVHSYL